MKDTSKKPNGLTLTPQPLQLLSLQSEGSVKGMGALRKEGG